MAFIEKFLTFRKKPEKKFRSQVGIRPPKWAYLFAFGAPLFTAIFLFILGTNYTGGLGNAGDTIFGMSRDETFIMLRKYTLFIPLTGLPFFFWVFARLPDRSDWARILKIYFVYSFVVWAVCYFCFLIEMFMPRF